MNSAIELFEHTNINDYHIDIEPEKKPPYKLIYN